MAKVVMGCISGPPGERSLFCFAIGLLPCFAPDSVSFSTSSRFLHCIQNSSNIDKTPQHHAQDEHLGN